jgi:hypothetical protein
MPKQGELMDNIQIDYVTVVVAAALNMLIGYFWYSKWLFGKECAKLCQHAKKEHCMDKTSLFYTAIVSLVTAYFLAFFLSYIGVTTVTDGMFIGFCIWLGFVATTQSASVIWCKRPFKLFVINTAGKLLSYLVMSGVIGA